MVTAALLSERIVCATQVPSAFGGTRTRLSTVSARIDPRSLAVADDGLDIGRLLSGPSGLGDPRRVGALLRALPSGGDVAVERDDDGAVEEDDDGADLDAVLSAFAKHLVSLRITALRLPQRLMTSAHGAAVVAACSRGGVVVEALSPHHPRPVLFMDDAELVVWPTFQVLQNAGQRATLAAGLAEDVAAAIVTIAGDAGADVWQGGFDVVARALFVQRIERSIRNAPGVVAHLDLGAMLPPLSRSTSKVLALSQLPSPSARALELSRAHRARQQAQWHTMRKLRFDLRLPAKSDSWWTDRVDSVVAAVASARSTLVGAEASSFDVVDVVGPATPNTVGLIAALEARGHRVEEPDAHWLTGRAAQDAAAPDAADVAVADVAVADVAAPAVRTASMRIGGVRAADVDTLLRAPVSVASSTSPPAAPSAVPATPTSPPHTAPAWSHDWRVVHLPSDIDGDVTVIVDGVVLDDVEVVASVVGDAAGPRHLKLPGWVRAGSLVTVRWGRDPS